MIAIRWRYIWDSAHWIRHVNEIRGNDKIGWRVSMLCSITDVYSFLLVHASIIEEANIKLVELVRNRYFPWLWRSLLFKKGQHLKLFCYSIKRSKHFTVPVRFPAYNKTAEFTTFADGRVNPVLTSCFPLFKSSHAPDSKCVCFIWQHVHTEGMWPCIAGIGHRHCERLLTSRLSRIAIELKSFRQ